MNPRVRFALLAIVVLSSSLAGCGGSDGISSGLKMFVTSRAHNGDFAGDTTLSGQDAIEKADNFCQTDARKPADGLYKALLVDGVTRDASAPLDWVLKPETAYFQITNDVRIATTTSAAIFPTTLEHPIGATFSIDSDRTTPGLGAAVWTGFADGFSFVADAQNCRGWTYRLNADYAPNGFSFGVDGTELYTNGGHGCSGDAHLYCVQQ